MTSGCDVSGCTPLLHCWHSPSPGGSVKVGDYRVTYVVDGTMWLWPAQFFPHMGPQVWTEHPFLLDATGRLVMNTGSLLVQSPDGVMLIDAGWGSFEGDMAFGTVSCGHLLTELARRSIRPEHVDVLAFTHLHVDHVGWSFARGLAGSWEPVFPNARYVMAERELASHIEWPDAPGAPEASLVDALAERSQFISDGDEAFPAVQVMATDGHSAGHLTYVLESCGERLLAFGDAFHSPVQLVRPWLGAAPDQDSTAALEARKSVLEQLEQPSTIGFGMHFGGRPFGRLSGAKKGYAEAWEPLPSDIL